MSRKKAKKESKKNGNDSTQTFRLPRPLLADYQSNCATAKVSQSQAFRDLVLLYAGKASDIAARRAQIEQAQKAFKLDEAPFAKQMREIRAQFERVSGSGSPIEPGAFK